jgi:hypothetical protein
MGGKDENGRKRKNIENIRHARGGKYSLRLEIWGERLFIDQNRDLWLEVPYQCQPRHI